MTNLSDLFPAGAGKQVSFTASGNVTSSGKPVVLNSDGTVSEVSGLGATAPTETAYISPAEYYVGIGPLAYDTNAQKIVFLQRKSGVSNLYARVGTVGSSSVTWGSVVQVAAASDSFDGICGGMAYDANSQNIVIAFINGAWPSATTAKLIVGTVSGSSITFGTAIDLAGATMASQFEVVYDANAQKCVVFYSKASDNTVYGVVATISGSAGTATATLGTPLAIETLTTTAVQLKAAFDASTNKIALSYRNYNSSNHYYLRSVVLTVSGTSLTKGALTDFTTYPVNYISMGYDPTAQKVAIVYKNQTSNNQEVRVGTISGTSISYGAVAISGQNNPRDPSLVYDSRLQELMFSTSQSPTNAYSITISGTTATISNATRLSTTSTAYYSTSVYDVNAQRTVTFYTDAGGSLGYYSVYALGKTNLTAQSFVGVADSAISASAAGSIIVQGGTVSGVSEAAALRFGTSAVFEAANAGVITETFDSTNNKVVVAYKDSGNSNYGTAAVGTVSGSSISFGTPAVFESAEVGELSAAFDSNENRVVISYRDAGNSNYGTAVVGQVSGTSISFGTAATFSGTNASYNTSTAFDSSNNKIVVSYRDNGNSNYGTAVVGTVSGASITFGTPVVYSAAGTTNYGSITYDSTSNKIVLCYQVSTDEKAIVGTVSGTSISFGSEATAAASSSPSFRSLSFDSTNNRVVDTYSDGSTGACTSVVGTVSGTSISFGTPVIADSANTGYVGSAFDVSTGKIVIVYNASSSGLANTGTVSGTTITFGDKVTFLSGDPNHVGAVYDSNANRVVVSYSDSTNSNYGTSIVASSGTAPLTVGTKYYVTPSGSFSSSAGDPSVNAGLAISTTSLLLNGDS
jgi:hypothetical protein